jgi:hypothetical protein
MEKTSVGVSHISLQLTMRGLELVGLIGLGF